MARGTFAIAVLLLASLYTPQRVAFADVRLDSTGQANPLPPEHPGESPGAAAPAPEPPLPARAIGGPRFRVGPLRLQVDAGDPRARRGEWNDAVQPHMFSVSVGRAPGA